MPQRDPPANQPMAHNPNEPHRNPNLIQPGHDPAEIDQRPVPSPPRRTSSLWAWVALGVVALVLLGALFLMGGTTEVSGIPTQGPLPVTDATFDAH